MWAHQGHTPTVDPMVTQHGSVLSHLIAGPAPEGRSLKTSRKLSFCELQFLKFLLRRGSKGQACSSEIGFGTEIGPVTINAAVLSGISWFYVFLVFAGTSYTK